MSGIPRNFFVSPTSAQRNRMSTAAPNSALQTPLSFSVRRLVKRLRMSDA